ncbi:DUF4013 domain-containing protein [Halosegnis marinus]|uniref:DUF4013 domain-containing protein n=1 Tax=Halosegnis marinus TaxID=3034023 RepID=A0ABD5ZTN2_9EURY|nr:DUF4013 domain-containing protein [Halosegnis sp. DT85]
MVELESAVNYPRESENPWTAIAIGSALTLFSVLLLPAVLLVGYYQRVLRASMDDEAVPVFDDWGDLFVEGLKAVVVVVAYSLVPALVIGASIASAAGAVLGDGGLLSGALALGALFGVLLGGLLGLVLWYVAPAGLANLARTGRIASAFALGDLRHTLVHRDYAVSWLVALGVVFVAGIVTSVFNLVPFGFVLGIPVTFYAAVVAFHLYGRGVAAAGPAPDASDRPDGRAAV